jgi:amino acid transporter
MNIPFLEIFLLIGGFFGFLGALMAYFITYNEWVHHYEGTKEPRKMAFRAVIFTFTFFIILSILLAYIFSKINL